MKISENYKIVTNKYSNKELQLELPHKREIKGNYDSNMVNNSEWKDLKWLGQRTKQPRMLDKIG